MLSRINIFFIIGDHLKTFADNKGRISRQSILFFFIIPLIPCAGLVYFKHAIAKDTVNILISVLSIFVGLLLNLLVLLFELAKDKDDIVFKRTIKETITNISYAVIVSIFGIISLLACLGELQPALLLDIISLISYYCITQFFITMILTLKKIYILFMNRIDKL